MRRVIQETVPVSADARAGQKHIGETGIWTPACRSGAPGELDGQWACVNKGKRECTNLIEEADAREYLLDALLELAVWSGEGDVGSVGDAAGGC